MGFGLLAAGLLAGNALRLALSAFGLVGLLLDGAACPRPFLDLGLGLRDGAQALLAPRDLRRHVQPVVDGAVATVFGQHQLLLHLLAQLILEPVGVLPRQRPVLAAVGRDLGAFQRNVARLQALHLARPHQHLDEQRLDRRQEAAPEGGDAVMVRLGVGGNETERHRVVAGALDLATGVHAVGVAVHQQAKQHRRVLGRTAASGVLPRQLAQVQLLDHRHDKTRQVIPRQPPVQRRRQPVGSVSVHSDEAAREVGVCLNAANIVSAADRWRQA